MNKNFERIAWGAFLIMLGGFMFVPDEIVKGGWWSIGVGSDLPGIECGSLLQRSAHERLYHLPGRHLGHWWRTGSGWDGGHKRRCLADRFGWLCNPETVLREASAFR